MKNTARVDRILSSDYSILNSRNDRQFLVNRWGPGSGVGKVPLRRKRGRMARVVTILLIATCLATCWEAALAQASVEVDCDLEKKSTTRGVGRPDLVERYSYAQVFTVSMSDPVTLATRYREVPEGRYDVAWVQERLVHRTVPLATTHALVLCERDDYPCDQDKKLPIGRGILTTTSGMTVIDLKQGSYTRRETASLEVDGDRMDTWVIWSGACRTRSGEPLPLRPVTRPAEVMTRPSPDDMGRYFPPAAQRQEVGGNATILCSVSVDGKMTDCQIVSESEPGLGFGEATIRVSRLYKMIPALKDGQFVPSKVRLPVRWIPPQ